VFDIYTNIDDCLSISEYLKHNC